MSGAEKLSPGGFKKNSIVIFIVITLCFWGALIVKTSKSRNNYQSPTERLRSDYTRLHRWVDYKYIAVPADMDSISNLIVTVPTKGTSEMDRELVSGGREAVGNLLLAFSAGNYEAFERYRFPIPAKMNDSLYPQILAYLTSKGNQRVQYPKPPPWAIDLNVRDVGQWRLEEKVFAPSEVSPQNVMRRMFERRSLGTGYAGYFQKICVQESYLDFTSSTNLPESLSDIAGSSTNSLGVGNVSALPLMSFDISPAQILKQDGKVAFLTTRLFVQLHAPDTITPIYARFYYSPPHHVWLPYELVTGNLYKGSYILLLF